jgi:adenosylhomocysteine nucleosidase
MQDRTQSEHSAVLLVTALSLEFTAVERLLQDVTERVGPLKSVYRVGYLATPQGQVKAAMVQTGAGNTTAALEAERAIQFFQPQYLFFVGIAGGVKDVALGDVVAATKVYAYESGKAESAFLPRPEVIPVRNEMIQRAMSVERDAKWIGRISYDQERAALAHLSSTAPPRAFVGAIAAGEKVVASNRSEHYKLLRKAYSDALAIEMEGYGTLKAAFGHPAVSATVIRGISDLIVGKREADRKGWQPRAAAHAAAFAAEMISAIANAERTLEGAASTQNDASRPTELLTELVNMTTSLYPTGPTDRNVWLRAGGDLSQIDLSPIGRTAWQRALHTLLQGGGGTSITIRTLVDTMSEDFPNNQSITALRQKTSI